MDGPGWANQALEDARREQEELERKLAEVQRRVPLYESLVREEEEVRRRREDLDRRIDALRNGGNTAAGLVSCEVSPLPGNQIKNAIKTAHGCGTHPTQ